MKPLLPYSLLAAAALCGVALGQTTATTTPVGYVTETLKAGQFNLVGLTLLKPVVVTGSVSSVSGATIAVPNGVADALQSGKRYTFDVRSGSSQGAVLEVASFDAAADTITFTTADNGLSSGNTFALREAPTLGEVFGTGSAVLIGKGTATTGDLIFVPSSGGGFDVYHHTADSAFGSGSWTRVGGGGQGANTPLIYTDAIFVQVRGASDLSLVVSGEVKVTSTAIAVVNDFEYVSGVYPVGSTLASSGLANSTGFKKGSSTTGDLVFIPNAANPGSYRVFHHTADSAFGAGAWTEVGGSGTGATLLTSGFIIQRRAAAAYMGQINPPASYATL
jgi:hypothetical protein